MNPMFGRKQLDRLTVTVAKAVEERVEGWRRWNGSGEVVDLDPPFGSVTMHVLLTAMFGTAIDADDVDATVADFRHIGRFMAGRLLTVWAPGWMPVPFQRRGRPAVQRVNAMIDRIGAARRADPVDHDDLLSVLVDARFEDGAPLSPVELRDELMGLLFGGFETTQSALGWTVALLDAHPEAKGALVDEIAALGGGLPTTWDEVQELRWTKACFDEAQRLQGAPLFNREAVIDQEIGGLPVPAGSIVAVSPFSLHRKPSLWREPDRYDPTRFIDADIDRFAFIPFGAGPRHCIGSNLAYLEATLTLAALYGRHEVRMRQGFTPQHDFHLSTGMKGGCPVLLEERVAA
jgi:cytochrome P450